MPFTPYHFGPSAFFGLLFKKWIDLPVFVLANVVVDLEVLIIGMLGLKWPYHRYAHTLLIGAAVALLWALAAYPLRNVFKYLMNLIRLPYRTTLFKMLLSAVLGVWLHVFIDAIYHYDVRLFWPSRYRPVYKLLTHPQLNAACLVFFAAALITYIIILLSLKKTDAAPQQKT